MEHRMCNQQECPHPVALSMNQAKADLENLVWPVVLPSLGDGEIETIEGRGEIIFRRFDCRARVDYIFESAKGVRPMFGIAARVTYGHYRNLTLGEEQCEALKLLVATPGAFHPAVIIHACVEVSRRERKLSEVALVPVDTFLLWARTHPGTRRVNHQGKTFFAWSFACLQANDGCPGTLVLPHPLFSWGQVGTDISQDLDSLSLVVA